VLGNLPHLHLALLFELSHAQGCVALGGGAFFICGGGALCWVALGGGAL